MNVAQFSPFGLASEETGLVSLVSNFLSGQNHIVTLLRCNGLFSLCDRDGESQWRRGISSCLGCMSEQQSVARWSGSAVVDLSPFITPEEILMSKRWLLLQQNGDLCLAKFEDIVPWELCRRSFAARFGTELPESKHPVQIQVFHRMLVAAVRAYTAARNFLRAHKPELLLVAAPGDYISGALVQAATDLGQAVATFSWDLHARSITIRRVGVERDYQCPIVFEDVTTMRPDSRTWPWELIQIMEQLATFLGVAASQLELPIVKGV